MKRGQVLSSRIGPMGATPEPADRGPLGANATPGRRYEPKPELELKGVVEPALARALLLAAEAGRWAIVEQIARELKESVLQTGAATIRTLEQLRAMVSAVALDDFGTSYSSIASLEQLPIRRVKLGL